jgi:signal transduction histidine kinase
MGEGKWSEVVSEIAAGVRGGREGESIDPESRDRFHEALMAELPLGVVRIDASGRASYMNPLGEAILGIAPGKGSGADCFPRFETPGLDENPIVLGLEGKLNRFEMYVTDREGRERSVWVQMTPIPAGDSTSRAKECATEMLILLRDTSDERAFDDEMRRRERLASIGELSAGVAHEIRNPLTGIANCAQVLRDRILPDDPRLRFVSIILDEAARLNRIVDSLLTFARPPRPQLRESDLATVVRRAFDLEKGPLEAAGIAMDMKIRGKVPRIYIDPEQILQVLLNVVRNAAESMPGGGRLILECFLVRRRPHIRRGVGQRKTDRFRPAGDTPAAAYLQIRISDTGRGIPQDVLPRIFDPFFTTRPKGTGLGLSISQSIIIEHGGFISVRSVEGRGTTVSIDLPVERRRGERRNEVI